MISFHIHLCCWLAAFMLHATFRIQAGYVVPRCAGALQRERPWTLMGAEYIQRKNFAFSVFNIVCLEFCLHRGWHLCKTAGRAAPGLDPAENKARTPENERARVLQSFPKPASVLIPLYLLTRLTTYVCLTRQLICSIAVPVYKLPINGIILYASHCPLLLWINILFWRFIHISQVHSF